MAIFPLAPDQTMAQKNRELTSFFVKHVSAIRRGSMQGCIFSCPGKSTKIFITPDKWLFPELVLTQLIT